ncbi:endonuclease III domain-containing protein [bacterium]|nr:endonuclease III domain-containing protein [bacterium]
MGMARARRIHDAMSAHFGPLSWWPGETPFEVCVGAILTQNTAWSNVERAIANLKDAEMLTIDGIADARLPTLAKLIRPSGYFNQKAVRLRHFARWVRDKYGNVEAMRGEDPARLRAELLALSGIGPETADSMLLYAMDMPIFVVDAYTKRIFHRKGAFDEGVRYGEVQDAFHGWFSPDRALYNEYHAQIVNLGKDYCKKTRPRCEDCPIRGL